MLKVLYKTNNFGRLVRTVSSKVTVFLADETMVMLFLSVLGNIFFLEVPEWFFGRLWLRSGLKMWKTAQEKLPITGFNSEGYPVYPAKLNGHFLWDSPGSKPIGKRNMGWRRWRSWAWRWSCLQVSIFHPMDN